MEVSNEEIFRYLKTENKIPDEKTSALIEEIINELKENIVPKSVYKIFDCEVDTKYVTLCEIEFSSANLAKHLYGCHCVVLSAATLGTNADVMIRKFSIQDMGKAFLTQEICTAMLEVYLDAQQKEISQMRGLQGLFSVSRFSPGYGDFDIKYQKEILSLTGASRIGISLTQGYMLTPIKSVTAVIGFSRELKKSGNKCDNCNDAQCGYSQRGFQSREVVK